MKLSQDVQEILQREPIEHSILNRVAMRDPQWEAVDFVTATVNQPRVLPDGLIPYVRHEIEATCAAASGTDESQFQAYMRGLDEIWPMLEAKMCKSYGLAEYMRTFACHSVFLPRYYATLYHPMALEAPFGMAVRLDGKFMRIPVTDPAYKLCAREPIFVTARIRTALQQSVQLELGEGAKVVSLGAAMLPEYNHFGWQERNVKQQTVAYDNALGVMECLQQVYEKPLSAYGIDYRNDDFWHAFDDSSLQGACDLVAMEGGLSYYKDELPELLCGVAALLRPGGVFCGEVELKNIYTIRCGVLGWQMPRSMHLYDDAEVAIRDIKAAAAGAGLEIVAWYVDDQNVMPAMVWFHLRKSK